MPVMARANCSCTLWASSFISHAALAFFSMCVAAQQVPCLRCAHPARSLLANDEAIQLCIADNMRSLGPRCLGQSSSSQAPSLVSAQQPVLPSLPASAKVAVRKDAVTTLIRNCLDNDGANKPPAAVNMLMVAGEYSQLLQNVSNVFSYLTGLPVTLTLESTATFGTVSTRSLSNAGNASASHSLWMLSLISIGDGLAAGAIKNLTDDVIRDRRVDWLDLLPVLRTAGLLYGTSVVGLPWLANVIQLSYRRDMFARYQWQPPDTWDELIEFAKMFNGTEGMHGLCIGYGPCQRINSILLRNIVASLIQTGGPSQGWVFNPDTMEPLLGSPAMEEALRIYKELMALSGPDLLFPPDCSAVHHGFVKGKCIMSIHSTVLNKLASHVSSKDTMKQVYGKIGVTLLPGTDHVLDMKTKALVPCDPKRCPYSILLTSLRGNRRWVSKSPSIEIINLSINSQLPPDVSQNVFTLASLMTSPAITETLLYNPAIEFYPSRFSHMNYSIWRRAGYNLDDISEILDGIQVGLSHPNAIIQLRFPGATDISSTGFGELARNVTSPSNNQTIKEMAMEMDARVRSILAAQSKDNPLAFKKAYWVSLNRDWPNDIEPARKASPMAQQTLVDDNSLSPGYIALAAALPTAFVLAVIGAIVYWRKVQLKVRRGSKSHPGVGPLTTLVVSDIESSTLLWEMHDAEVMDAAVKLHNGCIRTLAADNHGYESIWEGDSFVIAFHKPQAALQFSLAAQKELLSLAWPSPLLSNAMTGEVWVKQVDAPKRLKPTDTTESKPFDILATKQRSVTGMSSEDRTGSDTPTLLQTSGYGERNASTASGDEPTQRAPSGGSALFGFSTEVDTLFKKSDHDFHRPGSVGGGSLITTTTTSSGHARLGQRLQSTWRVVESATPGATLVYRGLRVRMGMHAGLASETDIHFNTVMGRFHYSGPLRMAASAITSAAHGGQILISEEVANLLDPDALGVLRLLPQGCQVYHMGLHQMEDMPDQTAELMLVLSNSLKGRLVIRQEALRTKVCLIPSIYLAPVPNNVPGSPTLDTVRVAGLDMLLAWNQEVTSEAVRMFLACARQVVTSCGGIVSDNRLLTPTRSAASMTSKSAAAALSSFTPGQYVVALPDAHSALHFALRLRHSLLQLDWPEQLLTHALCEQLGSDGVSDVDEEMANILHALSTNVDRSMPGFIHNLKASKQLQTPADVYGPQHTLPPSGPLNSHACQPSSYQSHTLTAAALQAASIPPAPLAPVSSGNTGLQLIKKYMGSRSQQLKKLSVAAPSAAQLQIPVTSDTPPVIVGEEPAAVQPVLLSMHGAGPCYIISPLLRGLRIRQAVLSGDMKISIHTQGTGRVVYQGKAVKSLPALMAAIKAGQIGLSANTVRALLQGP